MNNMSGRAPTSRERNQMNCLSEWMDEELVAEFRMRKQEIKYVCSLVKDDMAPLGSRSSDTTLEEKVLICLKTLGSGSFQNCSKDFVQVSQPRVSKILTSFSDSMVKLAPISLSLCLQHVPIFLKPSIIFIKSLGFLA